VAENRGAFTVLGLALVAAAGVGGYFILKGLGILGAAGPKSYIASYGVKPLLKSGDKWYAEVQASNIGTEDGYFKLHALAVPLSCRYQGQTGWAHPTGYWDRMISECSAIWIGEPVGQGWKLVPRGGQETLRTPARAIPAGTYSVYLCVAVSKNPDGSNRLYQNEHYLWVPGVSLA